MWAFGSCQLNFAEQCTEWIVDVYRASAWCFLAVSSFPATFCYFPFSFYALACGYKQKTVSLNWSNHICDVTLAQCDGDFVVCSCSQIINEEKEGDGSLHEGTKWVTFFVAFWMIQMLQRYCVSFWCLIDIGFLYHDWERQNVAQSQFSCSASCDTGKGWGLQSHGMFWNQYLYSNLRFFISFSFSDDGSQDRFEFLGEGKHWYCNCHLLCYIRSCCYCVTCYAISDVTITYCAISDVTVTCCAISDLVSIVSLAMPYQM
jgi:hypothetical protein